MLTNEEVSYLLSLNKVLKDPEFIIDLGQKKNKVELISHEDTEVEFLIEITSNKKIILKTSLHHHETNNHIGLIRIDFKGSHKNPEEIKPSVPEFLRNYVGQWINFDQPHMHIFVEDYRPLAWAIPLEETTFPIKDIKDVGDLFTLIDTFAKHINVTSKLNIQHAIF
ncbi:hypothetical protein LRS05_08500 [Flavobacterium sp. J372]|uniref:DUF6978 family protein n=1 Tax=Flavobacterium sp. J372 TaxID=2898436 RepID=UPI002150D1E8|nr:hypothetical protein [Flavobacterium sp. J372]MCR5862180.1 hypothetical protein [Flavobacterium sp. J372]